MRTAIDSIALALACVLAVGVLVVLLAWDELKDSRRHVPRGSGVRVMRW